MFKIGEFSEITKITVNMLRHYDEIGLLKPDRTDTATGYRYYSEKQLPQAAVIQALKDMGFKLPGIKGILKRYTDTESLKRYLIRQGEQKRAELRNVQWQVKLVDAAVYALENGTSLSGICVSLKEIPARTVMYLRETVETYADQTVLWKKMANEADKLHIVRPRTNKIAAVYYNRGFNERFIDMEVQQTVIGTYEDQGILRFKNLPAVTVAAATFRGQYQQLHDINKALKDWINTNGYENCGFPFDIYHLSPGNEECEDNFITEVCYPIRKVTKYT